MLLAVTGKASFQELPDRVRSQCFLSFFRSQHLQCNWFVTTLLPVYDHECRHRLHRQESGRPMSRLLLCAWIGRQHRIADARPSRRH